MSTRKRGGAPFRPMDPSQPIETAIMAFLSTSRKTVISHGAYGTVLKCEVPPESSSFVHTLDPTIKASTIVVKVSVAIDDPDDEGAFYNVKFVDSPKIVGIATVFLDDFENEVKMQRNAYHDSIEQFNYPICPMILFSKSIPQTEPFMSSWIQVEKNSEDELPPWSFKLIAMEMLSEDVTTLYRIQRAPETKKLFEMTFIMCLDLLALDILHNDLHLNNVLVANNRAYIIDFGRAQKIVQRDKRKYVQYLKENSYLKMYRFFYRSDGNDAKEKADKNLTMGVINGMTLNSAMYRPPLLTEDQQLLLLAYCPDFDGKVKGLTPEREVEIFKRIKEHALLPSPVVPAIEVEQISSNKRGRDDSFAETRKKFDAINAGEPIPPIQVVHDAVEEKKTHLLGRFGLLFARVWDRVRDQAKRFKPSGGSRRRNRR